MNAPERVDLLDAADGQTIAVTVDDCPDAPTVLLVPPFGATARNLRAPAHLLVRSGVRVLRMEPRSGTDATSPFDFRLSVLQSDMHAAALHYQPDVIAAISLSARLALRIAAEVDSVLGLALLTPVIDLPATLEAVAGDNYFERPDVDIPSDVTILGYTLGRSVYDDARLHGYEAPLATDLARITRPMDIEIVCGDQDTWVRPETVHAFASLSRDHGLATTVSTVPGATHQLDRNPAVTLRYLRETVASVHRILRSPSSPDEVSFGELVEALSD